jgi:hypothetical protein
MNWRPVDEWPNLLAGLTDTQALEFGREDSEQTFWNSFGPKEHNELGFKFDPMDVRLPGWEGPATRVRVKQLGESVPVGLMDPA